MPKDILPELRLADVAELAPTANVQPVTFLFNFGREQNLTDFLEVPNHPDAGNTAQDNGTTPASNAQGSCNKLSTNSQFSQGNGPIQVTSGTSISPNASFSDSAARGLDVATHSKMYDTPKMYSVPSTNPISGSVPHIDSPVDNQAKLEGSPNHNMAHTQFCSQEVHPVSPQSGNGPRQDLHLNSHPRDVPAELSGGENGELGVGLDMQQSPHPNAQHQAGVNSGQNVGIGSSQSMGMDKSQQMDLGAVQHMGVKSEQMEMSQLQQIDINIQQQLLMNGLRQIGANSQQLNPPSSQQIGISTPQQMDVNAAQQMVSPQQMDVNAAQQMVSPQQMDVNIQQQGAGSSNQQHIKSCQQVDINVQEQICVNSQQQQMDGNTQQQMGVTSQQEMGVASQQQMGVTSQQQMDVTSQQQMGVASQQHMGMTSQQQMDVTSQQQMDVTSQQQMCVTSQQQMSMNSPQQMGVTSQQQMGVASQQQMGVTSQHQMDVTSQQQMIVTSQQQMGVNLQLQLGVDSQQQMEVNSQRLGLNSQIHADVNSQQQLGVDSQQQMIVTSQQMGVTSQQQMGVTSQPQMGVTPQQQVVVTSQQQIGVNSQQLMNGNAQQQLSQQEIGLHNQQQFMMNSQQQMHVNTQQQHGVATDPTTVLHTAYSPQQQDALHQVRRNDQQVDVKNFLQSSLMKMQELNSNNPHTITDDQQQLNMNQQGNITGNVQQLCSDTQHVNANPHQQLNINVGPQPVNSPLQQFGQATLSPQQHLESVAQQLNTTNPPLQSPPPISPASHPSPGNPDVTVQLTTATFSTQPVNPLLKQEDGTQQCNFQLMYDTMADSNTGNQSKGLPASEEHSPSNKPEANQVYPGDDSNLNSEIQALHQGEQQKLVNDMVNISASFNFAEPKELGNFRGLFPESNSSSQHVSRSTSGRTSPCNLESPHLVSTDGERGQCSPVQASPRTTGTEFSESLFSRLLGQFKSPDGTPMSHSQMSSAHQPMDHDTNSQASLVAMSEQLKIMDSGCNTFHVPIGSEFDKLLSVWNEDTVFDEEFAQKGQHPEVLNTPATSSQTVPSTASFASQLGLATSATDSFCTNTVDSVTSGCPTARSSSITAEADSSGFNFCKPCNEPPRIKKQGRRSNKKLMDASLCQQFPASANGYQLKIIEQPEDQHRARYKTEGSRGSVKDRSQRGHPTVKLLGINQTVTLQVFVGNDSGKVKPHGFYQSCKVCGKNSTPCTERDIDGTTVIELQLDPANDMVAKIDCVGILKLRNADVEQRMGVAKAKKKSLKARLVFRVSFKCPDGGCQTLQVASHPILCTQPIGCPEICKKSLMETSVDGGDELFIIGKNFMKGTKVLFQEIGDNGENIWEAEGELDTDYFQNTHLICTVPAYRNSQLMNPVSVQIVVRCSGKTSYPQPFTYLPKVKQESMETEASTQKAFLNKVSPAALQLNGMISHSAGVFQLPADVAQTIMSQKKTMKMETNQDSASCSSLVFSTSPQSAIPSVSDLLRPMCNGTSKPS